MLHLLGAVAVGGMPPALRPGPWDAAPLVLAIALALLMRRAHLRLPTVMLLAVSLLGGLVLDSIDDAVGISLATSIAVLALVYAGVSVRRSRTA
jgi:uncharacterized membrane-anchored protein